MNWSSTARIIAAFVVAGAAVWFGPDLLDPLGLGEFAFVGRLCLAILLLSALDKVFTRFEHATGTTDHPPPDR